MVDPSVAFFGPLDTVVGPYAEYIVLVFAVVSMVTRHLQHSANKQQAATADADADALSRHPAHAAAMVLLVLSSFYYLTLHHHAGMVLSTLVLGTFISDFFEFEARKVEVREDHDFDAPKGAIVASVVTLMYISYLTLFFLVKPYWNAVV